MGQWRVQPSCARLHGSVRLQHRQPSALHEFLAPTQRLQHSARQRSQQRRRVGHVVTQAVVAEHVQASIGKPSFVEVLRGAAPYVQSHRNSTCVVCLPSEVSSGAVRCVC
jgi:hypothetical protein